MVNPVNVPASYESLQRAEARAKAIYGNNYRRGTHLFLSMAQDGSFIFKAKETGFRGFFQRLFVRSLTPGKAAQINRTLQNTIQPDREEPLKQMRVISDAVQHIFGHVLASRFRNNKPTETFHTYTLNIERALDHLTKTQQTITKEVENILTLGRMMKPPVIQDETRTQALLREGPTGTLDAWENLLIKSLTANDSHYMDAWYDKGAFSTLQIAKKARHQAENSQ